MDEPNTDADGAEAYQQDDIHFKSKDDENKALSTIEGPGTKGRRASGDESRDFEA